MPLPFSFNPMEHAPLSEFIKPPIGEYEFVPKSHEMLTYENSGNTVLAIAFETPHGMVQIGFDLWHTNEIRARIQHQLLGALCRSAGVLDLGKQGNEIELIYDKPVIGIVRERKDNPEKNEVFNFKQTPSSAPVSNPVAHLASAEPAVIEAEPVAAAGSAAFQPWTQPKPASASKPPAAPKANKPAPAAPAATTKMPWE